MSKTFVPAPRAGAAASQRSRGRGRGQTLSGLPPVQSEKAPSFRGRGTLSRGTAAAGQPGSGVGVPVAGRGTATIRRDIANPNSRAVPSRGARGGRMDPYSGSNPDRDAGVGDGPPADNSLQGRATHTGAYTVIPPNERKRSQVTRQAERGLQQYEEHKQRNTQTSFSYVGTAGGGEMGRMDEATVRHQQILAHNTHNKPNRLLRDQERRRQQRDTEDRELDRKKEDARRQSNLNTQREGVRQQQWKSEMHRANNAFLDRLEAQGREAATASQSSPEASQRPHPATHASSSQPVRAGPHTQSTLAGQRSSATPTGKSTATHAGRKTTTQTGAHTSATTTTTAATKRTSLTKSTTPHPSSAASSRPQSSRSKVATSSTTSKSEGRAARGEWVDDDPHYGSTASPSTRLSRVSLRDERVETHQQPESRSSGDQHTAVAHSALVEDGEQVEDGEFYDDLELMQSMFPQHDQSYLLDILQQSNGSVEQALQFLGIY